MLHIFLNSFRSIYSHSGSYNIFPHLQQCKRLFCGLKALIRSYTTIKALPITWQIVIIDKKHFTLAALDLKDNTFVVYLTTLSFNISLFQKALIGSVQVERIIIPSKLLDFANIFSLNSVAELPKHTGINNYLTSLIKDQLSFYWPIYNLETVKLELLKT